ncbi:MAG: hypothetical protein H0U71_07755 [Gammaproteobacteria bacterium]|nr:hypothetical protein [Gammaproteobacteria bacterium]
MKRAISNIITFIFLGFLLIGLLGVFQNIVQDIHQSFAQQQPKYHVLAYDRA